MTDLAILVPSRGRPASVARLIDACAATCRTSYVLHFGFDDDDLIPEAVKAGPVRWTTGPRMGLSAWTNALAIEHLDAAYLASLGDDHLPITTGWDEQLITAIEHMGGGFAYPNDGRRSDVPEAVVISTPVVKALGWMCPPMLDHWYIDNAWRDLGAGAGCLAYCRDVMVAHLHPNVTGQPGDRTYNDAAASFDADLAAYQRWRMRGLTAAIRRVCEVVRRDAAGLCGAAGSEAAGRVGGAGPVVGDGGDA